MTPCRFRLRWPVRYSTLVAAFAIARAFRQVRADEVRHRDLAPPRLARHLGVDRGEARRREQPQEKEQACARAEEAALEARVVARGEARRYAQPGGGEREEAGKGPHQVAVEVDAHEDVGSGQREDERDEPEPRADGGAEAGGRPHRDEQHEHEGEGREEEGGLSLREADRHLGGVEAEEEAAQHVDAVLRGGGERLDRAVVGQERLLADGGLQPGAGQQALQRQHQEARADRQPRQQSLAARRGGAAEAGRAEDHRHREALGAREGDERARGGEGGGAAAARVREPAVEQEEREEEEESDVGAVEVAPDDGPAEGDEGAGEPPLPRSREALGHPGREGDRREEERGAEEDGERDEPLAPRPGRVGEGEDRGVEEARGPRGRCLARVVAEGVALGHRLRVLRDHVEVADLRHEVAARRPQEQAEEGGGDGQPEEERAHRGRS